MKNILYLLLIFTLLGCSNGNQTNPNNLDGSEYEHTSSQIWGTIDYKIVEKTIDDCEYIIIFGADGRNIIHKENCSNSAFHICK